MPCNKRKSEMHENMANRANRTGLTVYFIRTVRDTVMLRKLFWDILFLRLLCDFFFFQRLYIKIPPVAPLSHYGMSLSTLGSSRFFPLGSEKLEISIFFKICKYKNRFFFFLFFYLVQPYNSTVFRQHTFDKSLSKPHIGPLGPLQKPFHQLFMSCRQCCRVTSD